jgi:MFS family permease
MRQRLNDTAKLAVAAVSTANGYSIVKSKTVIIATIVGIGLIWTVFVLTAFIFFSRIADRDGERFRLSLGFSLATLICPLFSMVPICLNSAG